MKTLSAYLTFSGNCREAMIFYKKCLGGELTFQTIGDSPLGEKVPEKLRKYILHSTLTNDNLLLMGSDMVPETGLIKGNAVTLTLNCDNEKEIRSCYKKLCVDGQATHPLKDTFWGALFGDLTDKYGNNWILNFQEKI